MRHRIAPGFRVLLTVALGISCFLPQGCKPKSTPAPESHAQEELVLSIHWLGKNHILNGTNGSTLQSVWGMPESLRLEAQFLDKLALAPWRSEVRVINWSAVTNYASLVAEHPRAQILRPLLENALNRELYVEVLKATNSPPRVSLAIHAGADQSVAWVENLNVLLESAGGVRLKASTETRTAFAFTNAPGFLSEDTPVKVSVLTTNDWVIVSTGDPAIMPRAVETIAEQTRQGASDTNSWLEVVLKGPAAAPLLKQPLLAKIEEVMLEIRGEGADIHTRGRCKLANDLGPLEPWIIPTNLITDPLVSFSAVRGIEGLLTESLVWTNLPLGTPPSQAFATAKASLPFHQMVAFPVPGASNRVAELTNLIPKANAWIASNAPGRLEALPGRQGITWAGIPFMAPYVRSYSGSGSDFLVCGLMPSPATNQPAPKELFTQFAGRTNLVYYHWELTGPRVPAVTQLSQLVRFLSRKTQLPPESAGMKWLVALEDKLGNSGSVLEMPAPTELTFARKSGLGLTAIELQLFADWIESPEFPVGLNTFKGPPGPGLRATRPSGKQISGVPQQNRRPK